MRPPLTAASVLVVVLLLASCAGQRVAVAPTQWEAHRAWVERAPGFVLEGRVGTPSGSANVHWDARNAQISLRLWGPLGMGAAAIAGDARAVTLTRGDGETVRGAPSELLSQALGFGVPYAALSYWARGVPEPGVPVRGLELADGRAATFEQAGFLVAADRYMPVPGGSLPGRISVRHGDYRLTLLVHRWVDAGSDGH